MLPLKKKVKLVVQVWGFEASRGKIGGPSLGIWGPSLVFDFFRGWELFRFSYELDFTKERKG